MFVLLFQSLITWDSGNQLTYPVKYIDPGYEVENKASGQEEAKSTGYEVNTSRDKQ